MKSPKVSRFSFFELLPTLLLTLVPALAAYTTSAPLRWILTLILLSVFLRLALSGPGYFLAIARGASYFAVALGNFALFVSFYFQNAGFNDAFFFHIDESALKANIAPRILFYCSVALITGIAGSVLVSLLYKRNVEWRVRFGAVLMLPVTAVFWEPAFSARQHLARAERTMSSEAGNRDWLNRIGVASSLPKRTQGNLVFIYVEGFERRFFDARDFPGVADRLQYWKQRSWDFTKVRQLGASGWTMGGIVASHCGFPLFRIFSIRSNETQILPDFYPDATCLGDILARLGYDVMFFGGADQKFAGKAKFLKQHGFTKVIGKAQLLESDPQQPLNGWGAYDDFLLRQAWKEFQTRSHSDGRFAQFVLTLGTHPPSGYLSPTCKEMGLAENYLDTFRCTDRLVGEFISKIRESEFSEQTTIVVMSDHLVQSSELDRVLEKKDRYLTFFINKSDGKPRVLDVEGSHYDVASTVLSAIGEGAEKVHVGLGSSLLFGKGYLFNLFSAESIGPALGSRAVQSRVRSLWRSYRIGESGIKIDPQKKRVSFGSDQFYFGYFDHSTALPKIAFEFERSNNVLTDVFVDTGEEDWLKIITSRSKNPDRFYLLVGSPKLLSEVWPDIESLDSEEGYVLTDFKSNQAIYGALEGEIISIDRKSIRDLVTRSETSARSLPRIIVNVRVDSGGASLKSLTEILSEYYERGYRAFGVDVASDGKMVCMHDLRFRQSPRAERVCGKASLAAWFNDHPDAVLLTAVKSGNIVDTLRLLKDEFDRPYEQIVPQIYFGYQYRPVSDLGFPRLLWAIDRSQLGAKKVRLRSERMKISGVVIPAQDLEKLAPAFSERNTPTWIDAINDEVDAFRLRRKFDIRGVYTERLPPGLFGAE